MSDAARPAILSRLRGVQRAGAGWLAFCPAHDDTTKRSLSVGMGDDGKTLVNCKAAGCDVKDIVRAAGLTMKDLAGTNGHRREDRGVVVKTYDYVDERGALLYQAVRLEPKAFYQRRPDGRDGWINNLQGVRRVLYRLPELAEQSRVFFTEGEKDADNLWAVGVPATTAASGAKSWRDDYAQQLVGLVENVVVLPDNDEPGHAYAATVARAIHGAGIPVKILNLPDAQPKGDVSDWLAAGHTADELRALADAAVVFTEELSPPAETPPSGPEIRREGLDLSMVWPDGTHFRLASIRDGREGVRGELTVSRDARRLSWGLFALASTSARESLRKKLDAVLPDVQWGDYLEEVAYRLTQAAREGEPLVTLTGTVTSPTRELIPNLLYEGEPTSIHADGDTGKSLFATTLAAAMQSGAALPFGLRPARAVPTAYLDWETSRDTIESRVSRLAAGLGIDVPPILYKRMARPLVDEAAALAADFARRGIGFVVIDSMMFAVGSGDGAAFHEPITAFYNALRLFAPAATLVLNHVTNADARGGGAARPFGGAFAFNGPRLIWEAKRDVEITDSTAIAFTCRKANNLARKPDPFALRFVSGHETITVFPLDLKDASPNVVAGASLTYRVRLALASNADTPAATQPEALANALHAKEDTIERLLRRLRKDGAAQERPDGSWALL